MNLPYALTVPAPKPDVTLNIDALTNGTVTADKEIYKVGDTVTLTVTSDEGYMQKLYLDGQPMLLDYATGTYSFVTTKATYEITGSFQPVTKWFWSADWNLLNQAHNVVHAPAHPEGTQKTGELVPAKGIYNGMKVLFRDASHGDQKEFAIVLKITFTDGKQATVRLIDRDDNGKYCLQAMGDSFSNWSTLYWLTDAENAAVQSGNGVWYSMSCVNGTLKLAINDAVVKEISVDEAAVIDQVKLQAYNFGYALDVPYILLAN